MADYLNDAREFNVFIPARFDDLNLTLEAYRVYCYLVRLSRREERIAYPSYQKIGEKCFRGSYPNSSKACLKAKAIAAINELISYCLIRKETYDEGEGHKHNIYHITAQSDWKKPASQALNVNIRKGRQGLKRATSSEADLDRLTGITDPVNGDNPVNGPKSVNGDNPNRLTGITDPVNGDNHPVNPTPPKGNTREGNTKKGNTREGNNSLSVSAKTDDRGKEKKPKVKTLPNRNAEPKEVYASLKNLEGFEKFWGWYDGNCRSHPKRDGSIPAKGSKKFAAIAWRDITEHLSPEQYQEFRQGCLDFNWNINGVPHAENFLKHEHWKKAIAGEKEFLEDLQADEKSDPLGNVVSLPSQTRQSEQKSASGTIHHRWKISSLPAAYKPEFCEFLRREYLPSLEFYAGKEITLAMAQNWIAIRENDEARVAQVDIQYQAFELSRYAPKDSTALEERDRQWLEEAKRIGTHFYHTETGIDQEKCRFYKQHREEILYALDRRLSSVS